MSLEQDYTTVPGQLFACMSVVGPEAPQKNDQFGVKIRGAFSTRDEAANHAKRLQKEILRLISTSLTCINGFSSLPTRLRLKMRITRTPNSKNS